jgi:hypothetical protein
MIVEDRNSLKNLQVQTESFVIVGLKPHIIEGFHLGELFERWRKGGELEVQKGLFRGDAGRA